MSADIAKDLYRRNRVLAGLGWFHIALFSVTVVLMLLDDRQVTGVNAWLKPAKFMVSLAVYAWTLAWFSKYIAKPRWAIRAVSLVIGVALVVLTACLLVQAARGTTSHYNMTTDFDAMVSRIMVSTIATDLLMMVVVFLMFRRPSAAIHGSYLWGIRFGIAVFLFGGWAGVHMLMLGAHTVGLPDGAPGLPLLGWSTVAGDLRIAHGLGLHALQLLPLAGYGLSRWREVPNDIGKLVLTTSVAVVYALLVYLLYRQALSGVPLIAL